MEAGKATCPVVVPNVVKEVQFLNALLSMVVKYIKSVDISFVETVTKLLHPINASIPIYTNWSGSFIDSKFVQPLKVLSGNVVRLVLSKSLTVVRLVHPSNVLSPDKVISPVF